jgi:hypothetical protein
MNGDKIGLFLYPRKEREALWKYPYIAMDEEIGERPACRRPAYRRLA